MTYNDITPNERTIAGALALVMHLLFFVLLVFGVSWQKKQADPVAIVDLWSTLPPLPQPKVETPPVAEVRPPPEPPQPPPKAEPKPLPKPEPKPVVKPDIALKEKLEKERKRKEQEQAEAKKRELEKARELKEKQAKEAEAKRLAREQEEALKKLAQQQAAQAAAQQKLIDEYKGRIREKIKRFIVEPPNLSPGTQVEFDIVVLPGGEILGVKLKRPSGVAAYDNAVERAILKAQPLPLPPDPALFKEFRELNLQFRPEQK